MVHMRNASNPEAKVDCKSQTECAKTMLSGTQSARSPHEEENKGPTMTVEADATNGSTDSIIFANKFGSLPK